MLEDANERARKANLIRLRVKENHADGPNTWRGPRTVNGARVEGDIRLVDNHITAENLIKRGLCERIIPGMELPAKPAEPAPPPVPVPPPPPEKTEQGQDPAADVDKVGSQDPEVPAPTEELAEDELAAAAAFADETAPVAEKEAEARSRLAKAMPAKKKAK